MSCSGREDRIPSATEERGHRAVSRTHSDEGSPEGSMSASAWMAQRPGTLGSGRPTGRGKVRPGRSLSFIEPLKLPSNNLEYTF